ncbi:MAG TPA: SRPBCC family protein [Longimicrobiales bacterium]
MSDASRPELVYVTEIRATPEQVWQALTDPAFTERYWYGTRLESEWQTGSRIVFNKPRGEPDEGTVILADPPRKLVFAWQVNWGPLAGERASRVTFTIEPAGDGVKLTLVHDEFDEGSKVFEALKGGWPGILAGLKKSLEG